MSKSGQRFTEIARAHVTDTRDVVLSKTQSGTVLMAQQIKVTEGKRTHNIFLQGAFEIPSYEALIDLRQAIDIAINEMAPKTQM